MENCWVQYSPNMKLERKYSISKMIDDENGLRLFLTGTESDHAITVSFPGMVYAYQNRLELAALQTLNEMGNEAEELLPSDWTFFLIKRSDFAKSVQEESQGIYAVGSLIHFAVVSGNVLFEVITDALPELREWGVHDKTFADADAGGWER